MKTIVPLITCEIPFSQNVCKLVLGVDELGLNLVATLILANNQSRATLWVQDTSLFVGLLPWMIVGIHTLMYESSTSPR